MHTTQLESRWIPKIHQTTMLQNIIVVILGSILLAVSAQITIPLQPVPVTLQSFAALFMGMAFGPKLGAQIILAYLVEGACGIPVFANFGYGLPALLGPTGGYLFGLIPAAVLAGYLLQCGFAKYRITIFLAALAGTVALFIPGYLVLSKFVGFHNAYLFGVAPFYGVEICKLIFFTLITPFLWRQKQK